ncbi:MAG: bacterioferritin [Sorangiineae bacterium]|nr:bacterioferritin [Polyangiaceae bacterium]MEB2324077.1 bacterioferritin [Sorangiineae bacterium]
MKGDPDIHEILNELLTMELTHINQYFVHSRMCENWGYHRLAKKKREESVEEMKHADALIARLLFLEGVPNMQRLGPVRVGEDPIEQHELDLAAEAAAVQKINKWIQIAHDKGDSGTRELLAEILTQEEESLDWHETQLTLVKQLGREHYLAQQLGE